MGGFCVQIISAQQLPKINTDKPNSIVDPQVLVEIHGVAIDKSRDKTHRIDNNGNLPLIYCTSIILPFKKWITRVVYTLEFTY